MQARTVEIVDIIRDAYAKYQRHNAPVFRDWTYHLGAAHTSIEWADKHANGELSGRVEESFLSDVQRLVWSAGNPEFLRFARRLDGDVPVIAERLAALLPAPEKGN